VAELIALEWLVAQPRETAIGAVAVDLHGRPHRDQVVKLNISLDPSIPRRARQVLRFGEAHGDNDQVVATLNDRDPHGK